MKKIHIFLASSIIEFEKERIQIENFIRNVSDDFEDRYGIKIQPLLCENFDDAYTRCRKQEEYNQRIRESDFCFFIFFTRAGEYTREEFEVARKQFEESGKPKIYTYFKVIEDGEGEQSLYDFMEELDKTFGHYYGSFSHIDTVKLRILLSLKLQEMDFLEVKVEDGHCVIDGRAVMEVGNVSEFANNAQLTGLQRELEETEEEYYTLKAIYEKGNCDQAFYSRYSRIASKRQTLIDEIEELRSLIFNVSLRMVMDDSRGEITVRQKKAYALFEKGDYEGCMAVLDSEDIDNDFLRERRRLKQEEITVCRRYIREHRTAIEILTAMKEYGGRFAEIEERYEKIVPVIFEMGIELDTAKEYVSYLTQQNKDTKALPVAQKLLELYEDDEDKAYIIAKLAAIYNNQNQPKKAEEYFLKSIEIRERLAKENPERYEPDLSRSYNNAGYFYDHQGETKKAEEFYLRSIKKYERLAKENPERYEPDLATSYNNAGCFYDHQGETKKAEEFYLKSIEIRERLAKENPERYEPDLAGSYNNAGCFYDDQGETKKAEEFYLRSIKKYERLAKENPERYEPDLATSYNNAGCFYDHQGETKKAEEFYLKSIEIYERLAKENPERYESDLAGSYNNAGCFYDDQGETKKAEEFYLKSIEIYERLAKENPERYEPYLAGNYNNTGCFYDDQGETKKAEEFYLKSIEIRERLATKNPERYEPGLALSYYNYAVFSNDDQMVIKAYRLAKKHPNHPMCRQIIDLCES